MLLVEEGLEVRLEVQVTDDQALVMQAGNAGPHDEE